MKTYELTLEEALRGSSTAELKALEREALAAGQTVVSDAARNVLALRKSAGDGLSFGCEQEELK